MIKYDFKGFLDGKRVEFTATGESWKEILNKILNPNMETKQDKFEIDLNKYEMVKNEDGSLTFKKKEITYTYGDVINFLNTKNGELAESLEPKIDAYCKLLYTSLYTNSLFDKDREYIFILEDGSINIEQNIVPNFKIGEIPFTSKSSIELTLKILGEETIKKALA